MTEPAADRAPGSFTRDVMLMFFSRGGGLMLSAVSSIVMARHLGPSGRGVVAVALSLVLVLSVVGNLGVTTGNAFWAAKEPGKIPRVVMNSVWLALVVGILLAAAGMALHEWVPEALPGVSLTETLVALAALPPMLTVAFLQAVLLGEGRMVAYNLVDLLASAALVAALVVGFTVFDMGALGAIGVVAVRYLATALVYFVMVREHVHGFHGPDLRLIREMVGYALRLYTINVVAFLIIRIDMLLVNGYLGVEDAGLYSITVAFADLLLAISYVVSTNLFPRVARGGGLAQTTFVFRSTALVTLLAAAVSAVAAGPLIQFLYGSDFSESATLYYWLVPGIFALGLANMLAIYFAATGCPRAAVVVWFPALAVNVAVNVAFLHEGAYVAALSSSVAYAALLVLHVVIFERETGEARQLVPRLRETVELTRRLARARPQLLGGRG
jgi:O-antigen/teichoic acid export membrane protein